ncbi:hypothetical protein VQ02_07340 [Methylobacterium variabile]|uniref:Uncharacterized protein n=1 Tax=Methylobacterium variabile TaxID=298794 RepID=A0A0J6VN82_9HYPH|nr:DUF5906 domain-containing protein [Methylobacterium variabile]KMO40646.1 hypothetical protein VQ02_07340 [Methylobacterium variabile]
MAVESSTDTLTKPRREGGVNLADMEPAPHTALLRQIKLGAKGEQLSAILAKLGKLDRYRKIDGDIDQEAILADARIVPGAETPAPEPKAEAAPAPAEALGPLWTEETIAAARRYREQGLLYREIAEKLTVDLGREVTKPQVNNLLSPSRQPKGEAKAEAPAPQPALYPLDFEWTEEMKRAAIDLWAAGNSYPKVATAINERFGKSFTERHISEMAHKDLWATNYLEGLKAKALAEKAQQPAARTVEEIVEAVQNPAPEGMNAQQGEDEEETKDEAAEEEIDPTAYAEMEAFVHGYLDRRGLVVLLDGGIDSLHMARPKADDFDGLADSAARPRLTRDTIRDEVERELLRCGLKTGRLDLAMRRWFRQQQATRKRQIWLGIHVRHQNLDPHFEAVRRMAEVRFAEDPGFVAASIEDLVYQCKRKMHEAPIAQPHMLSFFGKQNLGKSRLTRLIASPIKEAARKKVTLKQVVGGEKAAEMWDSNLLIIDDLDKAPDTTLGEFKSIITSEEFNFRPMRTNKFERLPNVTTLLASHDRQLMEILGDHRGMRRYNELRLKPKHEIDLTLSLALTTAIDWTAFWANVSLGDMQDEDDPSPILRRGFGDYLDQRQAEITPMDAMSSFDVWFKRKLPAAIPQINADKLGWIKGADLHGHYEETLSGLRMYDIMAQPVWGKRIRPYCFQTGVEPHGKDQVFALRKIGGKAEYKWVGTPKA